MRVRNVILMESNEAALRQLREVFLKNGNYHFTYIGSDGDIGIKHVLQEKPDLVITGMFLKGTDGHTVIRTVKKTWSDVKIIAMGLANDAVIEKAINMGADHYVVKPFNADSVLEIVEDLFREDTKKEVREYANKHRKAVSIDEKISEIFISIGIPPHIKGYSYLRDAIKLTVERPYVINAVTKELYPAVAQMHNTSASKVERAIRHAIEVAWNRGRVDAINAIFGTRIYLGTEKPTNSEFVALVADKLILESMM